MKNDLKNILIAVVTLFCFYGSVKAQDRKFKLGATVYPNYSKSLVYTDNPESKEMAAYFQGFEQGRLNLGGNVFVRYGLTDKLSLSLGVGYLQHGERTPKVDIILAQPDPALGDIKSARFVYAYHYLEVPLMMKYVISQRFFVNLGMSGLINFKNKVVSVFYYGDGSRSRESNNYSDDYITFRRFNGTANLGVGINVMNKDAFSFYVQPSFQIGVFGTAEDVDINRRLFSFGLNLGFELK